MVAFIKMEGCERFSFLLCYFILEDIECSCHHLPFTIHQLWIWFHRGFEADNNDNKWWIELMINDESSYIHESINPMCPFIAISRSLSIFLWWLTSGITSWLLHSIFWWIIIIIIRNNRKFHLKWKEFKEFFSSMVS